MLPSLSALLILLLPNLVIGQGTLDTCNQQYACTRWNITTPVRNSKCSGSSCEYRVCVQADFTQDGCLEKSDTNGMAMFTNACGDSGNRCAVEGMSTGWNKTMVQGDTICQWGAGGTQLLFVLKDQQSCNKPDSYLPFEDTTLKLSCDAEGAQGVCNKQDGECVWRLNLPDCPSPSPATSPRPSASPVSPPASRSPSPSPSPSQSPPEGGWDGYIWPSPSPSASPRSSPSPVIKTMCQDYAGWTDLDGQTCQDYADKLWCKTDRKPGTGWKQHWGSFASFANGMNATTACCACGGGYKVPECVTTSWGRWSTCSAATCGGGTRTRQRTINSQPEGTLCPDTQSVPCNTVACPCVSKTGWKDKNGDNCTSYLGKSFCNGRDYGPGWDKAAKGTFEDNSPDGLTAVDACCGCGKMACVVDTVLVVDRSGSITISFWRIVVDYMLKRVELMNTTDSTGNRMGIVVFSTRAMVACTLTHDKAVLEQCINNIVYSGGFTYTADGIDLAGNMLQDWSHTDRQRVIEVITDGQSTETIPTQDAAKKQKQKGVILLAIGVGREADSTELAGIASEPKDEHWANLGSFIALNELATIIAAQCVPSIPNATTIQWETDPSPSPLPSPQPSESPAASPSPLASPQPSPSPSPNSSPSPEPSPPATCEDIVEHVPGHLARYHSGPSPDCSVEELLAMLPGYCRRLVPGCAIVECDGTLSTEMLASVENCDQPPQIPS